MANEYFTTKNEDAYQEGYLDCKNRVLTQLEDKKRFIRFRSDDIGKCLGACEQLIDEIIKDLGL